MPDLGEYLSLRRPLGVGTAPRPRSIEDQVRSMAERYGVDPELASFVAGRESGFQQNRVSPKGAIGVMQLMPPTASSLGVDPTNVEENVEGGVRYLKEMLEKYGGDVNKALAAYNAGPARVDQGGALPQETVDYVQAYASSRKPLEPARIQVQQKPDLGDYLSRRSPAPPAVRPGIEPQARPERGDLFTSSLVRTFTGRGPADLSEAFLPKLRNLLPESMRGEYASRLAFEVARAGPEVAEFVTSPAGMALIGAHLFPATAPFAAAADVVLGGYMVAGAVPTAMDALMHLDDPVKVGRAIVDIALAKGAVKGAGTAVKAVGEIPVGTRGVIPMAREFARSVRGETRVPPAITPQEIRTRLEGRTPGEQVVLREPFEKPRTLREEAERRIYSTPIVRGAASVLGLNIRKPPLLNLGQKLVDTRAGTLAVEGNRAVQLADWIKRNVPQEEQDVTRIGYVIEGDLPLSSLSPKGQEAVAKIRNFTKEQDEFLRKTYGDDLELIDPEVYLAHRWDFSNLNPRTRQFVSRTIMRDPFLRSRKIASYKYGMETGIDVDGVNYKLKPLYNNVADIMVMRHEFAAKAAANLEFANTLKDLGLIVGQDKAKAYGAEGWNEVSARALEKATYAGKMPKGETIFRMKPVKVHPDVEMAVNAIFKDPSKFPGLGVLDQLNSFTKQLKVGFSLFHHNALSEVAQAEQAGAGDIKGALKALAWPFDPELWRGVRAGIWEVRGKVAPDAPPSVRLRPDLVEPWLRDTLDIRTSEQEAAVTRAMREFGLRGNWLTRMVGMKEPGPITKAITSPVRFLGNAQYVSNRALFEYYMPGQMLHTAEKIYGQECNRLGPSPTLEQKSEVRKTIADHVNRAFGADNLERLLLTRNSQRMLRTVFFAPLWTLSNVRVLTKGFESATGSRITGNYIRGAALTYFLAAELANYGFTSYWNMEDKNGRRGGHWTWDNPGEPLKVAGKYVPGLTDNFFNIALGYNPDGSQRYIRLGKAFREPFLWATEAPETFGSKLAMPSRQVAVQLTRHEPGTGFTAIGLPTGGRLPPEQERVQRIAEIAEMFTPFSAQTWVQQLERALYPEIFPVPRSSSQIAGLPTRKIATFESSVRSLEEALLSGRPDLVSGIAQAARLAKIDPNVVYAEVYRRMLAAQKRKLGPPIRYDTSGNPIVPEPPPEIREGRE